MPSKAKWVMGIIHLDCFVVFTLLTLPRNYGKVGKLSLRESMPLPRHCEGDSPKQSMILKVRLH